MPTTLEATVLLIVGDTAELITPHTHEPEHVPLHQLTTDTGLTAAELPGRRVTVHLDDTHTPTRFTLPAEQQ